MLKVLALTFLFISLASCASLKKKEHSVHKRQVPFMADGTFMDYAAYDYYDWVCLGGVCQICDVLTGACCNPRTQRNCFLPDSCANNPCLSGGTCVTTRTSGGDPDFTCVCQRGLTGKYCQLIDEFTPQVVQPMPIPMPMPAPAPMPMPVGGGAPMPMAAGGVAPVDPNMALSSAQPMTDGNVISNQPQFGTAGQPISAASLINIPGGAGGMNAGLSSNMAGMGGLSGMGNMGMPSMSGMGAFGNMGGNMMNGMSGMGGMMNGMNGMGGMGGMGGLGQLGMGGMNGMSGLGGLGGMGGMGGMNNMGLGNLGGFRQ